MKPPTVDPSLAHSVADRLADEWNLTDALRAYLPFRWNGQHRGDSAILHLEDISGIPFVDGISGVQEYQHRARVRADDGDLFAAGTEPAAGYEKYCREVLNLGSPEFIHAEGDDPMKVAEACLTPEAFGRLVDRARDTGELALHPYMAIEPVWRLARRLAGESDADVVVIGPPPPVLWVANDKSHFSRLVEETLGEQWLVDTTRSKTPRELARALGELAERCERVALKRTRCASAMGNAVFDGEELRRESDEELLDRVHEFLSRTRWHNEEDVLAVEWCETDLSPSTQLWVPPLEQGPPVVEGVYEQLLDGPEKVFLGSRPSTLGEAVDEAIAEASLQVCTALQKLGYVGRCSFDFIVTGDPDGDFHARFIECNGRWGGTSTPMHLVDRIVDTSNGRPPYVATDYYLPESHVGMTFTDLRAALEDDLYSPDDGEGRFALYNVGPLEGIGKFDVISLGDSPRDARRGLDEILPERLGIG